MISGGDGGEPGDSASVFGHRIGALAVTTAPLVTVLAPLSTVGFAEKNLLFLERARLVLGRPSTMCPRVRPAAGPVYQRLWEVVMSPFQPLSWPLCPPLLPRPPLLRCRPLTLR